jgi:hypothetical protein
MWLIEIKGVTKDEFHDVCFMSAECKTSLNDVRYLKAQYFLKKDALSDIKDLQRVYPNVTYTLSNLGRHTTPLWFF